MPRPEYMLSQYNHLEISRQRGKRHEICLFFGPEKCMLLRQTAHYLGKYSYLANFLARNFGAAVAALRRGVAEFATFRPVLNRAKPSLNRARPFLNRAKPLLA